MFNSLSRLIHKAHSPLFSQNFKVTRLLKAIVLRQNSPYFSNFKSSKNFQGNISKTEQSISSKCQTVTVYNANSKFISSWFPFSALNTQKASGNSIAEQVATMSAVHKQTHTVSLVVVFARSHLVA